MLRGRADAALDVVLEDQQGDRVDRRSEGRRLLEDVDAVFLALDHPLDAPDLAFDAAEAANQDGLIARVGMAEWGSRLGSINTGIEPVDRDHGCLVGGRLCSLVLSCQLALVSNSNGPERQCLPPTRLDDTPREYLGQRRLVFGRAQECAERIDWTGGSARDAKHGPGRMTDEAIARGPRPESSFAHASEAEFARILDFYQVAWEYEPTTFPILWDLDGNVLESFSPDFFLPDLELFIELTTLQQRLVRKKNRKVRRLRELYPSLRIKLFYARDFRALMLKYGRSALVSELSGTLGQVMPRSEADDSIEAEDRLDGLDRSGGSVAGAAGAPDSNAESRSRNDRPSRAARRRAVRRAAEAAAHAPAT
jgi:hypothetical protein